MKQDNLRNISAKDLGKLNMPDFCPRCFWLERHLGKSPSVFPGIFSSLDAITKRSAHRSFEQRNKAPDWLKIPDLIDLVEGDLCFKLPIKHGNWILIGKPDDIFKAKDNSYYMIDYKTAKFTDRQDELIPIYQVQLNAYAYLAEEYGFKPISKLFLVYCQPREDITDDLGFELEFDTFPLEIEIDRTLLPNLLEQAREIVSQKEMPQSYSKCKGICQWVEKASLRFP